jgi:hypothetical protein
LRLLSQDLSPPGCVDADLGDVARPGWAHELLRNGGAAQGPTYRDRWIRPSTAEAGVCQLLDGRPGSLSVASGWVGLANALRAAVWIVRDPSVIESAKASGDVRTLVTSLDQSVALLDDGARVAYSELARPARLHGVDETLRLLRQRAMTQADALRAIMDLLDLSLTRRFEDASVGAGPLLYMAMPER